jgi:Zn-dependent protease with chaperone function
MRQHTFARGLAPVLLPFALSACGTTYQMPTLAQAELDRANSVIARESATPLKRVPVLEGVGRFERVAARLEPHAEALCRQETPERDCDLAIRVDLNPRATANAFQTVNADGPLIIITAPLLQGTRNDDEVAFVMGHEAGHHIASHMEKRAGQQLAGALILGVAAAYASSGTDYQSRRIVDSAMDAGATVGGMAYSQTYELEADMLGAYIAEAAGYDAEKGSLIFARREGGGTGPTAGVNGALSLWSTHPSSPQRVATVRYAVADARAKRAAGLPMRPEWLAAE